MRKNSEGTQLWNRDVFGTLLVAFCTLFCTAVQGADFSLLSLTKDTYLLSFIPPVTWGGNGDKGPELRCKERTDLVPLSQITHLPVKYAQYDPVISASAMCPALNNDAWRPVVEYTSFQGDPPFIYNPGGTPLQRWGVKAYCQFGDGVNFWTDYFYPPAQVILLCVDGRRVRPTK